MGQRHQVYVIVKYNEHENNKPTYNCIGAFHHQWCFGLTAATNIIRLALAAQKAKVDNGEWESYYLRDSRAIDVLVKSVYGVSIDGKISMVHNEAEYLIKIGQPLPENGDNNDGMSLLVIDEIDEEIRACLFAVNGVEADSNECKNWQAMTPQRYFNLYYRGTKAKEMLAANIEQAELLLTEVKPVTQAEFKKIFAKNIAKKTKND